MISVILPLKRINFFCLIVLVISLCWKKRGLSSFCNVSSETMWSQPQHRIIGLTCWIQLLTIPWSVKDFDKHYFWCQNFRCAFFSRPCDITFAVKIRLLGSSLPWPPFAPKKQMMSEISNLVVIWYYVYLLLVRLKISYDVTQCTHLKSRSAVHF